MPSLWKRQKGNRISRLVADLQTPPKRGGSLVVETGFPTSIVDLFVKNRDRLKKPSKNKNNFNQTTTTIKNQPLLVPHSNLIVPTLLSDEKPKKTVAHVEETVAQKNPFEESSHRGCKDENLEKEERFVCLSLDKVILLSILMGVLVVVITLYTRRFVGGITIGTLLLLLLEFVGNSVFPLFRPCDDAKRKLQGLFCGLVYKKENKGVFGGSIGVDSEGVNKVDREVVSKTSTDQEFGNNVYFEREMGNYGSGITLKDIFDQENKRSIESSCEIEVLEPNNDVDGPIELVRLLSMKEASCEIEVLEPNKDVDGSPIELGRLLSMKGASCEVEVLEPINNVDDPIELGRLLSMKGETEGGGKEGEEFEMVNQSSKMSKGKKFWKRFVSKHMSKKKKYKRGKENHQADCRNEVPTSCINENIVESRNEGENEEDVKQMVGLEESSISSSFDETMEWEEDKLVNPKTCSVHFETIQSDKRSRNSISEVVKQGLNSKCLAVVGITLAGLIRSRILALVLTVICCFGYKMMRCRDIQKTCTV